MKSFVHFLFIQAFLGLFILSSHPSFGIQSESDTVFTFPFHMDSRLIVFEGEMNGQPTSFAFDTGAALGLADKSFAQSKKTKIRGKKMTIRDTNDQTQKVLTAYTDEIKIGGFKVSNVKSLVTDMSYLSCQNYYLLGSNVIQLLNWQIDFDNKSISVSQKPFPVESDYLAMEVFYENTRPFTTMSFGGMNLSKVLIDTGYSRILDIDNSSSLVKNYIESKEKKGQTNSAISLSTGAASEVVDETIQILVDTLLINGQKILRVPTDFFETKSTKVGIGFFKAVSHKTIINNTNATYFLDLRNNYSFQDPFLLNLQYAENKVIIAGKSLEEDPLYDQVEIGDEVMNINGRPTALLKNECDFVNWYYRYKEDEMTIQTKGGQSLTFTRTELR